MENKFHRENFRIYHDFNQKAGPMFKRREDKKRTAAAQESPAHESEGETSFDRSRQRGRGGPDDPAKPHPRTPPQTGKTREETQAKYYSPNAFMDWVCVRTPNESEFHQAVRETASDILPILSDYPVYRELRILERLIEPERIISMRIDWLDGTDRVRTNRAWRVQFNSALGPYKGGLRFDPSLSVSVLKFLGYEQCFKNALTGLPLGGGKGGADFDPKSASDADIMRFCQAFMTALYRHIGPNTDVPAGDMGVGAREIGYLYGTYKTLSNEVTGVLTGKPTCFGGSALRTEATGHGLVMIVNQSLCQRGDSLDGKSVAISGSGNVALHAASKAFAMGGRVVSLSDSDGTLHFPDGLSEEALDIVKARKGDGNQRLSKIAEAISGSNYGAGKTPWSLDCDIALPCATQNELDRDAAEDLAGNGVKLVAEGANMPCTPQAIEVFRDKTITFIPGKAANAGGVAVSGLEMSQNTLGYAWSRAEVADRLETVMKDIHEACCQWGETRNGIDYVRGANIAGFLRLAAAMEGQGVV